MPTWLLRFTLGLPCRPQDRDELEDALPELFSNSAELPDGLPLWDYPRYRRWLSVTELRGWAKSVERRHIERLPNQVSARDCPAEACPLREGKAAAAQASPTGEPNDHPSKATEEIFRWDLVLAGGPGRTSSVGAFLDLVRKAKTQRCRGSVKSVYITDRFIFADVGEAGTEGGYNTLVEYLYALGFVKDSQFALYLPSWPSRSGLQRMRQDSMSEAQRIVNRLISEAFPNAEIRRLPQQSRFHDRLYLIRDSTSKLSGVFGPSLNGLKSEDIALMGEIDDEGILKRLELLLASA